MKYIVIWCFGFLTNKCVMLLNSKEDAESKWNSALCVSLLLPWEHENLRSVTNSENWKLMSTHTALIWSWCFLFLCFRCIFLRSLFGFRSSVWFEMPLSSLCKTLVWRMACADSCRLWTSASSFSVVRFDDCSLMSSQSRPVQFISGGFLPPVWCFALSDVGSTEWSSFCLNICPAPLVLVVSPSGDLSCFPRFICASRIWLLDDTI